MARTQSARSAPCRPRSAGRAARRRETYSERACNLGRPKPRGGSEAASGARPSSTQPSPAASCRAASRSDQQRRCPPIDRAALARAAARAPSSHRPGASTCRPAPAKIKRAGAALPAARVVAKACLRPTPAAVPAPRPENRVPRRVRSRARPRSSLAPTRSSTSGHRDARARTAWPSVPAVAPRRTR